MGLAQRNGEALMVGRRHGGMKYWMRAHKEKQFETRMHVALAMKKLEDIGAQMTRRLYGGEECADVDQIFAVEKTCVLEWLETCLTYAAMVLILFYRTYRIYQEYYGPQKQLFFCCF